MSRFQEQYEICPPQKKAMSYVICKDHHSENEKRFNERNPPSSDFNSLLPYFTAFGANMPFIKCRLQKEIRWIAGIGLCQMRIEDRQALFICSHIEAEWEKVTTVRQAESYVLGLTSTYMSRCHAAFRNSHVLQCGMMWAVMLTMT